MPNAAPTVVSPIIDRPYPCLAHATLVLYSSDYCNLLEHHCPLLDNALGSSLNAAITTACEARLSPGLPQRSTNAAWPGAWASSDKERLCESVMLTGQGQPRIASFAGAIMAGAIHLVLQGDAWIVCDQALDLRCTAHGNSSMSVAMMLEKTCIQYRLRPAGFAVS